MSDQICHKSTIVEGAPDRAPAAGAERRFRRVWAELGRDGRMMVTLVNLALVLSLGGLLALVLYRVARVALVAPIGAHGAGAALVLGARVRDGRPSLEFRRRLERAAATPGAGPIIVLGGRPDGAERPESIVGREYLIERGIPPERIVVEVTSRNTLENLAAAKSLLQPQPSARPLALITSRFHLARASHIARSLGIDHQICAAEDRLPRDFHTIGRIVRESYIVLCHEFDGLIARLARRPPILHRLAAAYRGRSGLAHVEV